MATPPEPKKIKRVRVIRVPRVIQVKTLHLRTRSHGICLWRHGWRLKWMVSPKPSRIGDCKGCGEPIHPNQPWTIIGASPGERWHVNCVELA